MKVIDFDAVNESIYLGSVPTSVQEVDLLRMRGISSVLNLQTDLDMIVRKIDWASISKRYSETGIELVRYPIRDFDPVDLQEKVVGAAASLRQLIDSGYKVYVHCTAGINRSPTVVIAYLHLHLGYPLDEATRFVKECRLCEPYPELIKRGR